MDREIANVFYGLLALISLDKLSELASHIAPILHDICLVGQVAVTVATLIYVMTKIRQAGLQIKKLRQRRTICR